ncbi:glutathione S-transferase family protein [Aestuariibacter halophilus]|uniref:Glutathione S-transferase family protein n=1 Tax=Fluctibacter halophilus TaxID=226011 RepID=A0ABS8GA93_9ALTE|nr:glutathione S-transferase family protein [Aestuariibacter halophilus]MCC2616725.1 glutathione S-transferase family protein [Aestuariibacter halophilus]
MKLYYYPISTYSQKVLLGLTEKHVRVDKVNVNVMDSNAHDAFRQRYPLGKIPVLEVDETCVLPESSVILEYIDTHSSTGHPLLPTDPDLQLTVRLSDRLSDLYLNDPMVTLLFAKLGKPLGDKQKASLQYNIDCRFEQLNLSLSLHPWITGDTFTLADCAAIPPLLYARWVYPFIDFPHLSDYIQRCLQRPSVQKLCEEALPVLKSHGIPTDGHRR